MNLQYHRIHLRIICPHLVNQIHLLRGLILSLNLHFGSLKVLLRHQNLILHLPFIHHQSPYLITPCLPILQGPRLNHLLNLRLLLTIIRPLEVLIPLQIILHLLEFLLHQYPLGWLTSHRNYLLLGSICQVLSRLLDRRIIKCLQVALIFYFYEWLDVFANTSWWTLHSNQKILKAFTRLIHTWMFLFFEGFFSP